MHGSTGGGWKRNASASPRQLPTQPTSLQVWSVPSRSVSSIGSALLFQRQMVGLLCRQKRLMAVREQAPLPRWQLSPQPCSG